MDAVLEAPVITTYQIRIEPDLGTFVCRSDQMLLDAMDFWNKGRQAIGCRGGGCGRCRVKLSEGSVEMTKFSRAHVSVEQQAEGYALACRSQPRSDLVMTLEPVLPRRTLK